MRVVYTIDEARAAVAAARAQGKRIGFVPTLGGLHEGHGTLMDHSVKECGFSVVSVFVNALQFGPSEDFRKYPREIERDADFAALHGVDLVFAPPHEEMYPRDPLAFVEVVRMTDGLCGAFRPGHFRGVTTVVTKLLNIVQPDVVYFGEKDAQQLSVVQRMVSDLNFPVEVRPVGTVREEDGLAMSTRNRYLSSEERRSAGAIARGLTQAKALLASGERNPEAVKSAVRAAFAAEPLIKEQYIEVVDADELQPVSLIDGRVLVAVAAYLGKTRLIDNFFYPS